MKARARDVNLDLVCITKHLQQYQPVNPIASANPKIERTPEINSQPLPIPDDNKNNQPAAIGWGFAWRKR
jgi:hypothetical protein